MNCKICRYIGQYAINWCNLFDHTLNTLLLGDSDETLSARVGRAQRAGLGWAEYICRFLSFAVKVLTLGRIDQDHCEFSLNSDRPLSREIWSWSKGKINDPPESKVQVIDDGK